ncbi:Protein N-acetyltransferase, RimJ/RimL family [Oceanospirillum multiglobuliferum]|uniref:GNAT family N-acetyltransferase n=1 Tax=Oceanospirillum multiglobuliferum TaxID=64969 RepID=A0A1T4SNB5_9GAMM|nr:GNAT family N-acetyltransferase [Oceanospirillum multiglobuliferum]OPX54177.1 GNAT family N-acetyltransferase [Oceanospirillum multiglobuliferum]SKA29371.1 Protein N-acetyltransferase, RimJ/RimL family [Oceanospirillum multiglobuliferum]
MQPLVPDQIETERLMLRQFKEEDWKDLHHYYASAQATKFTVGRAFTEGETWRAMCSMVGHWQIRGYGPYAVEEKSSGTVLGIAGFWYPNDFPSPEIKWALAPAHWGKGYASEAARAVQKVGLQYLPDISLISFINADNSPSIQLALAIGATLEKEVQFRGSNWHIYRHPSAI